MNILFWGLLTDDNQKRSGCDDHPKALNQPSNKKLEMRFFYLIESAVASTADNSWEKIGSQSKSPDDDHEGSNVLMVVGSIYEEKAEEGQGQIGEGPCQIVERLCFEYSCEDEGHDLDGEGDGEEEPEQR